MDERGWNIIDATAAVLWREYAFSKGALATTLVFRGVDGLVVVSPAAGMSDAGFDALREHGEVRALVANNTHHHLGQAAWRARFPDATSYAPAAALAVFAKKSPAVGYRPLSELVLPAHVACAEPPGYKHGEAFFSVHFGDATLWYTGDLLTNIERTPGPPIRWLFTWTGSAPGFRLFKPAMWLMVGDTKALRAWMLARLDSDPPTVVVPAHGPAFTAADLPALVRAQLERM